MEKKVILISANEYNKIGLKSNLSKFLPNVSLESYLTADLAIAAEDGETDLVLIGFKSDPVNVTRLREVFKKAKIVGFLTSGFHSEKDFISEGADGIIIAEGSIEYIVTSIESFLTP